MGEKGLFVPLSELESALWALGEGVTEPLLRPVSRKAGRPKASQLRQEFVGMVAFTVQQLRDLGYSVPEAHQAVADDELNRVGAKPDRGSDRFAARTIRDWDSTASRKTHLTRPISRVWRQLFRADAPLFLPAARDRQG